MGGPRMGDPQRPQRGSAEDDSSVENPSRHTASTDSARPKHSMLARRNYGLLAPAGTAVDPADAGDPRSEAGHGSTEDQEGKEPEQDGE